MSLCVILDILIYQIEKDTWVQCEHNSCLKWRRISQQEAEQLTDNRKWYCSMNKDKQHNSCGCQEERCKENSFLKYGYKYVYSQLPIGSLVWAKMQGHVKWPAILSPDPVSNSYHSTDDDGDVLWYHVEFLGKPHSHYWVKYHNVEIYGDVRTPLFTQKPKKKTKHSLVKPAVSYIRRKAFDIAVGEAHTLISISCTERLKHCIFKYKEEGNRDMYEFGENDEVAAVDVKREKTVKKHCEKRNVKIKKHEVVGRDTQQVIQPLVKDLNTDAVPVKKLSWSPVLSSLLNRSKEEKFTADVQALQNQDHEFSNTLTHFMETRGMPIKRLPNWQGVPVSLYQLYMQVKEMGGYHRVCVIPGGWSIIYREATGICKAGSGATTAKNYYQRNILPYELYKGGKNYEIVTTQKTENSYTAATASTSISLPSNTVMQLSTLHCDYSGNIVYLGVKEKPIPYELNLDDEDAMNDMKEIENMLSNFDTDRVSPIGGTNQFDRVTEVISTVPNTTPEIMKLKFYSNFYNSDSSQENKSQRMDLQRVPDSDDTPISAETDSYLKEMQNMANEIDLLNEDTSQKWITLK
ncbi:uncharacterized protein LOC144349565 [Saccoglossus kowalevskii]